ncbi:hypothetical protein EAE96_000024 [Botrytis aclada]|nr:hypothetical protein EAE96_000024 [Botrytis aclada]
MPLLYGEGTKAFVRLQEEIIKVSVDHTIFCWTWTSTLLPAWTNIIAPSPDTFQESRDFVVLKVNHSETYPPELFDQARSIFRLNHRILDGWGGLLALGDRRFRCVIFISCKIDNARRTRWFCRILPPPQFSWPDNEEARQRLLASQVASMKGSSEMGETLCLEIGGHFVIEGDGGGNGNGNNTDERSIVTARLDLGLGREEVEEIAKRI